MVANEVLLENTLRLKNLASPKLLRAEIERPLSNHHQSRLDEKYLVQRAIELRIRVENLRNVGSIFASFWREAAKITQESELNIQNNMFKFSAEHEMRNQKSSLENAINNLTSLEREIRKEFREIQLILNLTGQQMAQITLMSPM